MDSFGEEGELPEDGSRSVAQSQGAGGVGGDGTSETAVPSPQEVADPVEAIRGKLNVLAGAVQHLELELLPYMKGAVEECKAATAATSAAWREQQERAESFARARDVAESKATQLAQMMHQITAIAGAKAPPAASGPRGDGTALAMEGVSPPRVPAAMESRPTGDLLTLKRAHAAPSLMQGPSGDGDRSNIPTHSPSPHRSGEEEPARKQLRLIFGGGPARAADSSGGDGRSQ